MIHTSYKGVILSDGEAESKDPLFAFVVALVSEVDPGISPGIQHHHQTGS
jgi:hypothetical protein